jgi:hypothetical protein
MPAPAAGFFGVSLMPDPYQDGPVKITYVAAVPKDQAVKAVRQEIPPTWRAQLLPLELTDSQIAQLKLQPGQVSELSEAL